MRHVPPRQAESAFGVLHWTPQIPQFWASSASTASQSLAGLRSQSAVPGAQFWRRPAAAGSAGSGSGSTLALSAEMVTGTRAAQLPNPQSAKATSSTVSRATLFFTPR